MRASGSEVKGIGVPTTTPALLRIPLTATQRCRSAAGSATTRDARTQPLALGQAMLLSMERRRLVTLMEVILPPGEGQAVPEGARAAPLRAFVDDLCAHAPALFLWGVRASLWLLWYAPLWTLTRFATLPSMRPDAAEAVLVRVSQSPLFALRELAALLKMVTTMAALAMPDVQRRLGVSPVEATPPDWATPSLAQPPTREP